MSEVKWIKIVPGLFEDDKILLIESDKRKDSILVIWFKILCLAGKLNSSGVLMVNDTKPYTPELLAAAFRRPVSLIKCALALFEDYGMIRTIDGVITLPNWEKHQNVDELEQMRKKTNERVKKHRAKQKEYVTNSKCNTSVTLHETLRNAIEGEREEEIDIDISKEREKEREIHVYGRYGNVFMSEEEYSAFVKTYIDAEAKIEHLSQYMHFKGKAYDNHYDLLCKWAQEDAERNREQKGSFDTDEFFELALKSSQKKMREFLEGEQ